MSETPPDTGLNKLLSALNLPSNWLVVVIVLLSGGGNVLQTQSSSKDILRNTAREEDIQKAINEIHQMHNAFDGMESRQRDMYNIIKALPTPNANR